ncbi:hypothetical protein FGB62_162g02 [Gracilaria domingensis]|nr:hypothetical protein FGB62_162g02 [Gracilaria domingensis]
MPRRADAQQAPAPCVRVAVRRVARAARDDAARDDAPFIPQTIDDAQRPRGARRHGPHPRARPHAPPCVVPHVADPRLVRRDCTACLPLRQPFEGAVRVSRARAPGAADAPGTLSSRRAPHRPPRRPGHAARAAAPSVAQRMPLLTSIASVKAERDHLPQLLFG